MAVLEALGSLFDRGLQVYGTVAQVQQQRDDTGVQRAIAEAELARQQQIAEQAAFDTAAQISRNETLKKIGLYGAIALSVVTVGGYVFNKKRGR